MPNFATLSQAKLYSQVKRINERIAEVARTWGQNSAAYRAYETALNKLVPAELVTTSRKGNIRIKQGVKDIQKIENIPGLLKQIENQTKTSGEYRKAVERSYKDTYGGGQDDKVPLGDLQNFDAARQAVRDAADSGALREYLSGAGYASDDEIRNEKRRLTYDELFRIMEKINKEVTDAGKEVLEYIEDQEY